MEHTKQGTLQWHAACVIATCHPSSPPSPFSSYFGGVSVSDPEAELRVVQFVAGGVQGKLERHLFFGGVKRMGKGGGKKKKGEIWERQRARREGKDER